MILKKILTKNLSKKYIYSINSLKKTHWKYNLKKQNLWFNKNAHKNDIHFLVFVNEKIIGYVHLSLRTFYFKKKTLKKKYILFRNLIVHKNHRNLKVAKLIMNSVNNYIKKKNFFSFLLCKKRVFKFYKKFCWDKMSKSDFLLLDHKTTKIAMTFNLKKNKSTHKYFFSYYS